MPRNTRLIKNGEGVWRCKVTIDDNYTTVNLGPLIISQALFMENVVLTLEGKIVSKKKEHLI